MASIGLNELDEQPTIISFDLTLNLVPWKPTFILSKSSIGQIMLSFSNILRVKPKNKYETTLYKYLKPAVETLVNAYSDMLKCSNVKEQQVKYYNLINVMPLGVTIFPETHDLIMMKNAKIGELIKAAKQRLNFILERDTPVIYVNDEEALEEFNNMKLQINNFIVILDNFEKEFMASINKAHKSN